MYMVTLVEDWEIPKGHDFMTIRLPDGQIGCFVKETRATPLVLAEVRAARLRLEGQTALSASSAKARP